MMGASENEAPIFGPWYANEQETHYSVHASDHDAPPLGNLVCKLPLTEQGLARAKLIAASPALVAALRLMVEKYGPVSRSLGMERAMTEARAALSLAEHRPC